MTSTPGIARAKFIVSEYGQSIVVVLAIVGLISLGGAGWVYTHPPTTTVTDRTNEQTFQSTLQTSAVVTGDTALYRTGDRVENQPVYLVTATPTLTLDLRTTVPDGQPVHIDQRVELVMRATNDGDEFWQNTRVLSREEVTTSNGTVTTSTKLDIPEFQNRIVPVQNEVGKAGTLSIFVRVTTSYETEQYSGTLTRKTPLQLSQSTYSIEPLTLETTESSSRTREINVPTRDTSAYTIPAGIGVSAVLCAGVVLLLYRRRNEWGMVENQVYQNRYVEWISVGALSPDLGFQYVPVESLEDLVDVGIDMNKRVIHDRDRDIHAVIDGGIVYYYGDGGLWDEQTESSTKTDES